jgi:hypothetical protein
VADKTISQLTAAGSCSTSDLFLIENTGNNSRKVTGQQIADMVVNATPAALFEDQKAANTAGGSSTSGSWQTRTLNTEVYDDIGITLSSNQMTLPVGTYDVEATTTLYRTDRARARLQDVTNGVTLAISECRYGPSTTSGDQHTPRVQGRFTLSGTAAVELQSRVETSQATNGLGVQSNFGAVEVYSRVRLVKLS